MQQPVCLGCAAVGRVTPTAVMDHVIPHEGDQGLFWDGERQPACEWHHNVVKQRLEHRFHKGELGEADLKLDSDVAVALTRELIEAGEGPKV